MKQSRLLEFSSSAFAIEPGEDEHTNPGIFGKALANWIAQQLRARGTAAGKIIAEDFGWCVPVESKAGKLYVACANAEDELDRWIVFVFDGGLRARFFGRDSSDQTVDTFLLTIKQILQEAREIRELRETAH